MHDENYKVSDLKNKGLAVIFNHTSYDPKKLANLSRRDGTDVDRDGLVSVFKDLGFARIEICEDYKEQDIKNKLKELSFEEEVECLVVAVLTHGNGAGELYAKDTKYNPETLWTNFTAEKCHGLVGKPKIFLIQASGNKMRMT